jgi:hypothetical protein
MTISTLELTASLDPGHPISDILVDAIVVSKDASASTLSSIFTQILSTITNVVALAESTLDSVARRELSKSLEDYYQRFNKSLMRAHWLRGHLTKVVSSDWQRPHLIKWARKFRNEKWTMATVSLPATSIRNDFYVMVKHAETISPEEGSTSLNAITVTDTRRNEESFNNISIQLENIQDSMRVNTRQLSSRHMAIEDNRPITTRADARTRDPTNTFITQF